MRPVVSNGLQAGRGRTGSRGGVCLTGRQAGRMIQAAMQTRPACVWWDCRVSELGWHTVQACKASLQAWHARTSGLQRCTARWTLGSSLEQHRPRKEPSCKGIGAGLVSCDAGVPQHLQRIDSDRFPCRLKSTSRVAAAHARLPRQPLACLAVHGHHTPLRLQCLAVRRVGGGFTQAQGSAPVVVQGRACQPVGSTLLP